MKKKTIESNKGLGIGFFYFVLNSPTLTRDVTCSATLLGRKKYKEAISDEHPPLFPFMVLLRFFLPRKYSAVSSLALDYITLLYIVNELPLCSVSFCHYLFAMVFSKEDKITIQNDYEVKGWSAYKIWKDHSSKNWTYTSVKRLLKHFKDSGAMNRT